MSCSLSSGNKIDSDANHIFLHQGVVPNVNLTMATALAHQWDYQAHCWRPVIDVTGKSSDEQIYIAGDGGGIGGAKAAAIAGRLAASAIVARCGKPCVLAQLYYNLRHLHYLSIRPFLDRLYLPPAPFRLAQTDDTIICRCAALSTADVNAALAPFESTSTTTIPSTLSMRSRLPLSPPDFAAPSPEWTASVGHVLPPSPDEPDAGQPAGTAPLPPAPWQRLNHHPAFTVPQLTPVVSG